MGQPDYAKDSERAGDIAVRDRVFEPEVSGEEVAGIGIGRGDQQGENDDTDPRTLESASAEERHGSKFNLGAGEQPRHVFDLFASAFEDPFLCLRLQLRGGRA